MKLKRSLLLVPVWILLGLADGWVSAAGIHGGGFGEAPWGFACHAVFILVPWVFLMLDR